LATRVSINGADLASKAWITRLDQGDFDMVGYLRKLKAAGYDGPAALMSFNPHSVAALAAAAPDRPRGLTSCAFADDEWPLAPATRARLAALADFEATGASFVSHDRADLANPAVTALKGRGVPILTWTVRTPRQEAAAREVADNITFEGYAPAIAS
ncbi:MAG: hypothetical protein ABTQ27_04190, partial [Amaricoccus sp.]